MPWLLSIDTGGTFTDCLATSPAGTTTRVKVLSSSAIRARVLARPDARTITTDWPLATDVLAGCAISSLGLPSAQCPVPGASRLHAFPSITHHDHTTITLSADLPTDALPPGSTLEVRSPWQPPILAARIATATPAHAALPPIHMRLATTRGTNALLERKGHAPALFITRGFADLLDIADQSRPDLFALDIIKPAPLHACSIEVTERLAVDGSVLTPLDLDDLRPRAVAALAAGHTTAAVALLHSWINPAHEQAIAALLREVGFTHVCTSADLSPLIGFLSRTQSAVVNAYLSRVVGDYLAGVRAGLGPEGRLLVMTSAAGLAHPAEFHPKDSLLSGPAGGLLGAADAARRAGHPRILTFDMGGTSTDVARCTDAAGAEFPLTREHRVADARILAPAVQVESVAAGGGSVCSFDRGELRVGPESAGASPGPACYGAGGPLTVTDCHVLLGRIAQERFAIPVNIDAARVAATRVLEEVNRTSSTPLSLEALLEGFLALADERMADAIRRISIRQGEDPSAYALLAFGGAGGLHACALADLLNVSTVIIPPDAGLLSARGLCVARLQRAATRQVLRCLARGAHPPPESPAQTPPPPPPPRASAQGAGGREGGLPSTDDAWLDAALADLEREAVAAVAHEGLSLESIRVTRRQASARVLGQSASFDLPADDPAQLPVLFADAYTRTFGSAPPDRPIEIESLLVIAAGSSSSEPMPDPDGTGLRPAPTAQAPTPVPPLTQPLFAAGAWRTAPILSRADLTTPTPGPAILADAHATTCIPSHFSARLAPSGAVVLSRAAAPDAPAPRAGSPIALELFVAGITAIAQDMGEMLRRTALSVNVKERLDFSCAILSPDGQLLVNAPHIPVHLGAIGLCVRALQHAIPMEPGDTVITNHPAYGGSHLPDITLVTPVHLDTPAGTRLIAYAASRAHHAELGGIRPGSMPPGATRLSQEGVVIPPTHLVRAGVDRLDELARTLTSAPYPSRAVEHNLADIRAALAANLHGARALRDLFTRTGPDTADDFCRALTDRAEARARDALARITPGTYRHADALDDGSPIAVTITIRPPLPEQDHRGGESTAVRSSAGEGSHPASDGGGPRPVPASSAATIDFAGSAPTHPQNFNATPAITTAATLYVLRLLAQQDIPLNEGLLRAIDLRIPEGTILNPGNAWTDADGPAVAAGNVETSQRVVDVLLLALGLAAASQGTMNNVAFGNDAFGFYETICGGAGATPTAPGASAVHTHMTNTRITDAEILEQRLPVRLRRFAIRRGSGGAGRHPGGEGVIRAFEFLASVELSILAQRRTSGPPGLAGGGAGHPGRTFVLHGAGDAERGGLRLHAGDLVEVWTPGGGGAGAGAKEPSRRDSRPGNFSESGRTSDFTNPRGGRPISRP